MTSLSQETKLAIPRGILEQIANGLVSLHPVMVVLFGSRARGRAVRDDSDIDLLVVLDEERAPETYSEKMRSVVAVRQALAGVNRLFSLDTLVFTRSEWERFRVLRPDMVAEIEIEGVRIA